MLFYFFLLEQFFFFLFLSSYLFFSSFLPVGAKILGVVDEGHGDQDHDAHDDVHGVEHGGGDGGLIGHLTEGLAGHQVQGDGAGQTRVPDHEAGVGGGDQKWIVHVTNPAGHFFGQEGAGDEAEAPVEPAADGGHEGGDEDGALFILGQRGNGA